MHLHASDPASYLGADDVIQAGAPAVVAHAAQLREGRPDDVEFVRAAFEWVRDEVAHSFDARDSRVTVTATEVLEQRVGLCYAKSHLLTALLRAEGVPVGLCYQRLADDGIDAGHVVHGLVAVYLRGAWHRLDPRGNKAGVDAQFSLSVEQLAWAVSPEAGEIDYPHVYASPVASVLRALRGTDDVLTLYVSGLPAELAPDEIVQGGRLA